MLITQKSRYGLRAVFELAKRLRQGPSKTEDIAKVQAIPPRFLQAILRELKQGGIVDSRRGSAGGYFLVRSPRELTVDEVIGVLQGPINPMGCVPGDGVSDAGCPLYGNCVFLPMWEETRDAIREVHQRTTFSSLVAREKRQRKKKAAR